MITPHLQERTLLKKPQLGIQSIEVAAPLLHALARADRPLMLSLLSKNAGMSAAKAHRYLISLIRIGLVEQNKETGLYDLGPFALELGLVSLSRLDAVTLAREAMISLRNATSETVALAVWGNLGPTYIHLAPSRRTVAVNLQLGNILPLTYTATGLCFSSFLSSGATLLLMENELRKNQSDGLDAPHKLSELTPVLTETREHGLARIIGRLDPTKKNNPTENRVVEQLISGFNAFSAPIFNHEEQMQFALTVVGSSVNIHPDWDGPIAKLTKAHAHQLSRRLGYRKNIY